MRSEPRMSFARGMICVRRTPAGTPALLKSEECLCHILLGIGRS